jgi:hypoxanthine phosphoribosyltransferase
MDSRAAPTLFIAIGGGGFIPARILRTFLKTTTEGGKRNIPIQAVGLTLYESLGGVSPDLDAMRPRDSDGKSFAR